MLCFFRRLQAAQLTHMIEVYRHEHKEVSKIVELFISTEKCKQYLMSDIIYWVMP